MALLVNYQFIILVFHYLFFDLGFIPVIGDFIGVLLALQLVQMAMQLDIPNELVSKMMFNIAFDFVVTLIALLYDVFFFLTFYV